MFNSRQGRLRIDLLGQQLDAAADDVSWFELGFIVFPPTIQDSIDVLPNVFSVHGRPNDY